MKKLFIVFILCGPAQNDFPSFLSHLAVSSPGHQTDRITSGKSIFVSCCGHTCSCSVDPRWKVTKIPGQCHRSDRGGGRETDAVVNTLQWEGLQWDREVHGKHIVSQSPPTYLCEEGTVWGRGGFCNYMHKYLKLKFPSLLITSIFVVLLLFSWFSIKKNKKLVWIKNKQILMYNWSFA